MSIRAATALRLPIALAAIGVLTAAAVGANASEPWPAKRALELASELEKTLEAGLAEAVTAPQQQTALQQRTRDGALVGMKSAHAVSREFATKLRIGWDRDDTELLFSQLESAVGRARETAADAVPQAAVAPLLAKMDSLLAELGELYRRE